MKRSEPRQTVSRKTRRRLSTLAAVALAALAGSLTAQQIADPAGRSALERAAVEALAAGRDADDLLTRLGTAGLETRPTRFVQPPIAAEPRELRAALARLEAVLGSAREPAADTMRDARDAVRAADLLYRERFAAVGRRLEAIGASPEVVERHARALDEYDRQMIEVLEPLAGTEPATPAALERVRAALADRPASGHEVLRAALLPYGRASLGQRAPVATPVVVPSYLDPTDVGSLPADLAPSPLAPLSEPILLEAEALGYDYVAIFERVRNTIDTEWYGGAMKGAEETLRQGRGNHADQAALLVALLRAAGAPARFVTGVVELPIESVADDLGLPVPDPALADRVTEALRRAGVPFRPVVRGGRVASVEVEHVWVATQVPYANYRGAVVDFSGATWIPLAPSIKDYRVTPAAGVLGAMADAGSLTVAGFETEILSGLQPADPLSLLRARVTDHLEVQGGGSYDGALSERALEPQILGLLPSSLPMTVVAVTGEAPELPASQRHRVRFVTRAGDGATAPAALDWSVDLAELAGRRVTLSYLPATAEDQRTIDAFGGLHSVPLYLVRLRPQIKVDGRPRAIAESAVDAGLLHRLEIEIMGPAGAEQVVRSVVAGGYYALDLAAGRAPLRELPEEEPADTESLGARLLARVAGTYAERWAAAEEELAALTGVAVVRPFASLAIASGAVEVERALGIPEQLRWDGVDLDAALRVVEPVAGATTAGEPAAGAARDWLKLAALQGSALEHRVFEELFLVDGVSADKGLGLARQAGIEILRLTPSSDLAAELGRLAHPASVEAEIAGWVALGMEVEVPRTPIARKAWRGSVWRAIDPAGRGSGYFIAGALEPSTAGGATTELPGGWVLQFLADALAAPYGQPGADDPLAGVEVVKVTATDRQEGTVGQAYPSELAVLVRDASGRPVADAPVVFEVWAGGGSLIDAAGGEGPTYATATNALGIASARFRSGTSTDAEPVYVQRSAADRYPTRALVNLVEVSVASHLGPLVPDGPFELTAYPGPPTALRKTAPTEEIRLGWASDWAGSLQVAAEDEHGNPVSNVDVTFSVGARLFEPSCPPPQEFLPAVVFDDCPVTNPRLGDCGASAVTVRTSAFGASAGVILGDTLLTLQTIDVTAADLAPVSQQYLAQTFVPAGSLACKTVPGVIDITVVVPVDSEGRNIAAARAGRSMTRPIDLYLRYARPKSDNPQSADYSRMEWVPTSGAVNLTVDNGGAASPAASPAVGHYQSTVTTGFTPGTNTLTFGATGVDTVVLENGELVPTTVDVEPRPLTAVTGVLPQILGVTPDPPVLGPTGHTTSEVVVGYEIQPPGYRAAEAEIDLYEDGTLRGTAIGTAREGAGIATVQRGFSFDVERDYELELVLNRGAEVEVRSDRMPLPLFQKILRDVTPSVSLRQDVDLLNQRVCSSGTEFRFTLTQPADITLEMRQIEAIAPGGGRDLGAPFTLISGQPYDPGTHTRLIVPGELPAGEYEFTLRAVSLADGAVEEEHGTASSELQVRDSLPVGHSLIHGVDLWDGHLSLSRDDLAYPGRGPALAFSRTYSSNAGGEPGPLGIGWTHTYESRVVVTPCGDAIVIGGEGSGMRFVDDGQGGLRPLKGYHGTLVANDEELAFDFYTKGGTRYRFGLAYDDAFLLETITDPNGNTTRLVYETGADGAPRLAAVADPAGRTLTFHYQGVRFELWSGAVVSRVDGPEGSGQSIAFSYDGFGNLIRAERENGARIETYAYAIGPEHALEDRHLLLSVTDELDGGLTAYETERSVIRASADIVVPTAHYTGVTLPEGGATAFEYDLAGLGSRAPPELVTRVTDPRGKTTTYHLNQYGSPVRVIDPLDHETTMTWAADDVVMTSRTDANGVTTTYDYDEHANLLSESVAFADPGGGGDVTLTRTNTYHPPSAFDPPYIKDRKESSTDRTGAVTTFTYDDAGNLTEQRITVTGADGGNEDVVTSHTYTASGDRSSTTDPRGEATRFTYDPYGNPATMTDPEGAVTTLAHDVRSLPVRRTDALGRVTRVEHDSLGRMIRRELPEVSGEGGAPEETWVYDDAGNTVTRTDALGRQTVTTTDLEARIVRIDNAESGIKLLAYDAAGNKTLETTWHDGDTPRHDTTFVYDDAGRLIERREPLGRTLSYGYDPIGNTVLEVLSDRDDPSFPTRVAEYDHDGLGRRVETRRVTDDGPVVTTVAYDGEGRPVLQVDPLGRQTVTTYDQLGRPVRVERPEDSETVNVYDGAGNLVEERRLNRVDGEPRDQVRRFVYDGAGRLVERIDALGRSTLFEYDPVGNLLRRIDRRLNVTSHTYDARDRRTSTTQHLDRVSEPRRQVTTRFAYDAVGNLVEERLPNGNVITHVWDGLDRKLRSEDTLGLVEAAAYDARGNVVTATDAGGHVTTTTWDALDRPLAVARPEGRTGTMTHDAAGNRIEETDPRGHTTTFRFDRLDRLVETTDPAPFGYTMERAYDAVGNLIAETDRRGETTTFEYDDLDRQVRTVAPPPLSYETVTTYDRVGNVLSVTDPRGIVTTTRHDLENRPVETRRAGLLVQQIEYDVEGNRRFVTDANGAVTGYEYDERNLLIAENRPLAAITRYTLDDMGDPVAMRDPENRITTFGYDLRRRPVSETNHAGETTLTEYDLDGNRTRVQRPEENAWLYRWDGAHRLFEVEDPAGGVTAFGYDLGDNRTSQTDALGRITTFEYDELDRMRARIYPLTAGETEPAREEYDYDPAGNRTEILDPKGQRTTMAHDELDRETLRTYPLPAAPTGDDLTSIATVYDPNGNPVRVTETYTGATGTRETVRTYDAFDRLETVTDPHGETIGYAYDVAGNRTRVTDPDGVATSYTFDALNRPVAVTGAAGVTEYEYFRDGRLKEVRYPNGTSAVHTYDAAGRSETITNRQGAAVVSSYLYEYDDNGNRTRQVETNGAAPEETTYAYDTLDRLTEVAYPDRVVAYGYDAVGNRRSERETDAATGTLLADRTYDYDERDRLLSRTDGLDPGAAVSFGYDANGNRIEKTDAGGTILFRYDVRDRLIETRTDGTLVGSYFYDYQGLRVAKRSGTGDTIRYVYDDRSVLLQTDLSGSTIAKYDYGPDRLLSLNHSVEGRQFYLFDALGSVVSLTDAAGAIEARYRYDAWGRHRSTAGTSPNPFGFTGHERDEETGLYYAEARYYDPELGLFLTEDPFAGEVDTPPSLHRYLYAYGNPLRFFDPTGRQTAETETDEERIAFLQEFGGLLRDGEEPPPGTVLTTDSLGIRMVTPIAQLEKERAEAEARAKEEEPGVFDKVVDFFIGGLLDEGEQLVEETSELGQKLDDGLSRDRRIDVQTLAEREAISTLGDANGGVEAVEDVAQQTGEVVKQTGRTALEAEESAGKAGIVGGLLRGLARRLFREGAEEVAEETTEAVVRGIPNATRLSAAEQITAARLQRKLGTKLSESPHIGAEYVDDLGRTYDAMGSARASKYWNETKFLESIDDHLLKSNDFTVIDLTDFTVEQANIVAAYVDSLPAEQQARIIRLGF